MYTPLQVGDFSIHWLNGGMFSLDAGTMFGVVPKVLWHKKYPCDEENHILLTNNLLLVQNDDINIIIETGLGNKLSDKQKKIFQITDDWNVEEELKQCGLSRLDIDHVILTHCDFDHAGGTTMFNRAGELKLTFANAIHYIQKAEWEDVKKPNMRSLNTYWPENFQGLDANLEIVDGDSEIIPGIHVVLTGGHTRGHQAVWIESKGEAALHLGDLLPNHGHANPLWVTAFDNFPLESVEQKKKLSDEALAKDAWLTFYHDPFMDACKFDAGGEVVAVWNGDKEVQGHSLG